MATWQQFIDLIASDPSDDAAKLVFADWLEENGNPVLSANLRRWVEEKNHRAPPDSWSNADIKQMVGRVMVKVERDTVKGEELVFTDISGTQFRFYHSQDCCEHVSIEDVEGNLDDLIGSPLTLAEEETSVNENPPDAPPREYQDSFTWTFYRFATVKGYVTVRWYGESNGYYSESVYLQVA